MSIELLSATGDSAIIDRFRPVLDVASDAVFLIHRTSITFLDVNNSACRLLGYSRDELLRLAPMALTGRPREYHEKMYDSLIAGDKPEVPLEVTLHNKAGALLTLEMQRYAHLTDKGWIILAVARDLSEIKQARESAAKAHAELVRLTIELQLAHEQERKQLATRLHGELGQLLAAMRINLGLLQQQLPEVAAGTQALKSMDELMVSSINTLRRIMADVRPQGIEDGELYQALLSLSEETSSRYRLSCELLADEIDLLMDESRSTMIYRIIEDALALIVVNQQVRNITVHCERQSPFLTIELCIDNHIASLPEARSHNCKWASLRERVRLMKGEVDLIHTGKADRITIQLTIDDE